MFGVSREDGSLMLVNMAKEARTSRISLTTEDCFSGVRAGLELGGLARIPGL